MELEQSLRGRRIAVPETRELDVFADLLQRRGASVLRCPLVSIVDAPDPAPVLGWLREFNAGRMSDLILLTGEGLRRLLACIERHEPALREAFVQRLAQVRKYTRGPKPAKALREIGLKPDVAAAEPTTAGVIAELGKENLRARSFGVQLYGSEPNLPLVEFLRSAGAAVHTVAPYVYADKIDDARVLELVGALAAGQVDAIAFTSQSQVERLFKLAETGQRLDDLKGGLARCCVAAVGPVVADALREHGVQVSLMPESAYFLKPLTQLLADQLGPR